MSLVCEDLLTHLDVPCRHEPPALPRDLSDHHREAVPLVPGKVLSLALHTAVGDGMTSGALGEFLLASDSLVTLETLLAVGHWFNVGLRHLDRFTLKQA